MAANRKRDGPAMGHDEPKKARTETTDATSTTLPVVKIDPAGDIYLVPEGKVRILVSSKVLSLVSKPFNVMFVPGRFLEGQIGPNSAHPPSIDLLEDNAADLQWLCKILHYKTGENDLDLHPNYLLICKSIRLVALTILGDKYDVIDALFTTVKSIWNKLDTELKNLIDDEETLAENNEITSNYFNLLIASYAMKDLAGFNRASQQLLLFFPLSDQPTAGSFMTLSTATGAEILPAETYAFLENRRALLRTRFTSRLRHVYHASNRNLCSLYLTYEAFGEAAPKYDDLNTIINAWESAFLPIGFLAAYLKCDAENILDDYAGGNADVAPSADAAILAIKLKKELDDFEENSSGLCMKCISTGRFMGEICGEDCIYSQ